MAKWKQDESRACELLGANHVGGSGRPDCIGENFIAEVKSYNGRRVHKGTLQRTHRKHWAARVQFKFVSVSGFTVGAIEYASREGIELFDFDGDTLYPLTDDTLVTNETSSTEPLLAAGLFVAGLFVAGPLVAGLFTWLAKR